MEPDLPSIFRCPISLKIMENPVTLSTGITYDRRSIEKWIFTYKNSTCPATMQPLHNLDLIPNHTLKNLILSWRPKSPPPRPPPEPSSSKNLELNSILPTLHSLRRLLAAQSHPGCAAEESLAVLRNLPFDDHGESIRVLSNPDSVRPMLAVVRRGSSAARLDAINILRRISKVCPAVAEQFCEDVEFFKSLLDVQSTRIGASALDLLLESAARSRASRLRAVEAGAVRVLIEILPDEGGRRRREKALLMLKRLCACAEGRSAFAEHGMGIAAVASRIGGEIDLGTKLAVKVLWLVCGFSGRKDVVEGMMDCGAVRKLVGLMCGRGQSSTKEKAARMVRMYGDVWRRNPCFPVEIMEVRY